ncbi:MAG: Curli production assembly/transport component CsgG [Bacteroidetes bacterium]|nr:MAG: Curli production assembly/transport component CsgG [Bacteroidota bacterium]
MFFSNSIIAQQVENNEYNKIDNPRNEEGIRDKNIVSLAIGAATINGDFSNSLLEFYIHIGYKHFLSPHTNISIGFNKFDLGYENVFEEGFISIDLNLEVFILPYDMFTPFVFAGVGLNAMNDFEGQNTKAQGGVGIEIFPKGPIGFKLFAEYNQVFADDLDGLVSGNSDDGYLRVAIGINYYFGESNKRKKTKDDVPTIINTNPIDNKN